MPNDIEIACDFQRFCCCLTRRLYKKNLRDAWGRINNSHWLICSLGFFNEASAQTRVDELLTFTAKYCYIQSSCHFPCQNVCFFHIDLSISLSISRSISIISTVKCRKMGNLKSAFVLRVFSPSVLFFNK